MRKRDWSELDEKLLTLYRSELRMDVIVDRIGIPLASIYKRLNELGVPRRKKPISRGYYRRPKMAEKAHPLVRQLYREARRQRVNLSQIAVRTGITREAIGAWANTTSPSLSNFIAVANYLGMRVVLKKDDNEKRESGTDERQSSTE